MDPDASNSTRPLAPAHAGANQDEYPPSVVVPDHKLLRCIGHGSYGEVWLARSTMGMYRAVKTVHRKSFEHQRPFERELSGIRKFEPISRSYEGFVDVLQVGINEEQGYFYYVMELGDDQTSGQNVDPERYSPKTLAKEISQRVRLSLQECLQLGLALSQSLAELHKHGLVHRDVKPSNIIFVNGVPKLADIGLVAEASEAQSYVGTEGFIPPEGPGTPQADVYGLGKVLYEVSTGKDRQEFPELPTLLDTLPDQQGFLELNEVILHACKHDITKRYQSAWDLHADLLVLANGKSVRRLKALERWFANLKRIASVTALIFVVLAAVFYHVYREWKAGHEARQRRVDANLVSGNRAMESGDLLGALPYFADALRLDEENSSRAAAHRLRVGSVLALSPKLTRMWFQTKRVNDGQFSPDGERVVIAEHLGQARIHDLQSGEVAPQPFGHDGGLTAVAYSSDGKLVATANEVGSVCIWDAVSLKEAHHLPHPNGVCSARFSPDAARIVTAGQDGVIRVFGVQSGGLEFSVKRHAKRIRFADFSHEGRLIVTASEDNTALLLDASTGVPIGKPLQHGNWVYHAAFSPDDQTVGTASADHKAQVWEVATGRKVSPDLNHRDVVRSAEFSPDGRLMLTASFDGAVRLWFTHSWELLGPSSMLKHSDSLTHASFSPDGRRVVSTCTDGSVRVWDLAGGVIAPVLSARFSFSQDGSRFLAVTNCGITVWDAAPGTKEPALINVGLPVEKAVLSRNGKFIVIVSMMHTNSPATNWLLQVRDAVTGQTTAPGLSLSNRPVGVSLSDDGKRLVAFGGNVAQAWDVSQGRELSRPLVHDDPIGSALLSIDGNRIATRSGNEVRVWNLAAGQDAFTPLKHPQPVAYAEYSPDGLSLVTCCYDDVRTRCYAQVWNIATGLPMGQPLKHGDGVLFASFSPDSRRVVTAGEDFMALVWDVATSLPLTPPLRHEHQVRTATFSPDGKWTLTASSDYTARVWSAETGDPLTPPLRHTARLTGAKFLPGGRRLVTFDELGIARIWELPVDKRPVDDLTAIARLLSGNSGNLPGQSSAPQSGSLETTWQRLRTAYPAQFTTSAQEMAAWHEFQAGDSENRRHWFAAAFHLERLVAIRNGDQSVANRLARAKEQLRKQ